MTRDHARTNPKLTLRASAPGFDPVFQPAGSRLTLAEEKPVTVSARAKVRQRNARSSLPFPCMQSYAAGVSRARPSRPLRRITARRRCPRYGTGAPQPAARGGGGCGGGAAAVAAVVVAAVAVVAAVVVVVVVVGKVFGCT